MSKRCALVLDEDDQFLTLVQSCLPSSQYEIYVGGNGNGRLKSLLGLKPDVIFIAVDLPEKQGFALLTEAKALAETVPVVLTTSTIAAGELDRHAKLKGHADAYLDKRTLTEESFSASIDALLGRASAPADPFEDKPAGKRQQAHSPEEASEPVKPPRGATQRRGAKGKTAGSRPGGKKSSAAAPFSNDAQASDSEGVPAGRLAELKKEISRLQEEVEDARLAARSSPFSQEFQRERKALRDKEREVKRLQKESAAHDEELAEAQQKLDETHELWRQAAQELQKVAQDLETEETAHQAAVQKYESELSELRTAFENSGKQANEDNAAALAALKETLTEQSADAVAAAGKEVDEKLDALRRDHEISLEEERTKAEDKIAEFKQEFAEERKQAVLDLERASQALEREHRANEQTQLQYQSEMAQSEAHNEEIQKNVVAEREAALEALEAKLKEKTAQAMALVQSQWEKKLEGAENAFDAKMDELQAGDENYRQQTEREHASALAALAAKMHDEKAKAVEVVESKWEQKLVELRQEHIAALETEKRTVQEESEEFGREATEELRRVAQIMGQERKAHEETRQRYESRLSELQDTHAKTVGKMQEQIEGVNKDLIKLRKAVAEKYREVTDREQTISSLKELMGNLGRTIEEHERDISDREQTIGSLKEILDGMMRN